MQLLFLRIASLVVIALIYMLFDVFNKRNIPTVFVYGTLAYAFILTVFYFNLNQILESGGIALVIIGFGYILYKIGQLGGADVVEFAALSLILPIQIAPLILSSANQLGFPFIISLIVNTGIIALIIVPIYYLPIAKKKLKKPLTSFVEQNNIVMSVLLVAVYIAFIVFAFYIIRLSYIGILILIVMLASSALVMLFSVPITYSMIRYITVKDFEEGDIIAINIMDKKDLKRIQSMIKDFNRLVTPQLIKELKAQKIEEKFPVYKEAMPFALPIFIALIVSLTIGNIMLLVLRI